MIGDPDASPRGVVALTGAAGFIGSAIRQHLLASGYGVRALYRPRRGRVLPEAPGLVWQAGELDDPDALRALMSGADAVVHCAGAVRGSRRADFDRVNEQGVRDTVEAAKGEPRCRRFLLLSSLAAREPQLSDYAGSKRRGELALQSHAGRLEWSVLRPPAVYGPGDREMRPLFDAMSHGWATIPGDGTGRFSLLHVADLATAVDGWLRSIGPSGDTHTLDDGRTGGYDWDTVLVVASTVLRHGRPIRRVRLPTPLLGSIAAINRVAALTVGYAPMLTPGKVRELGHRDWVCDNAQFTRATGWQPSLDLEHGLAQTFQRTADTGSQAADGPF